MASEIQDIALHETAQQRYLNYAMSVITSRALPDVRDGLKPVQRRILYAMFSNMRVHYNSKHRKSAAIVGDVMGKLHPHGDQAIYDAMVRMAQDFSLRYPMVDGQGNFGSIDGDPAAAMRYTEARLSELSHRLLSELGADTVAFRANYDNTEQEPVVLPAQVPNLLINGATGIAVGMATNIPPHNLGEVLDALAEMTKGNKRHMEVEDLIDTYIHGPDFPTGGVLLESSEELREIYAAGHGSVTLRARWEIETDAGGRQQIVVTELPYTVNRAQLVEKIASHIGSGKIPQLTDVRDESAEDNRIVIELKPKANIEAAMAYLFKHTPMQHRFHINLTCLVPSDNPQVAAPGRLSLPEILRHFLDFRMEVVVNRTRHELAKLERRIHVLEAFEIVFGALDEVLELIRASEGKRDAADKLIARFDFSEEQAIAILELQLYRLAKLEIEVIRKELDEKRAQAEAKRDLLENETKRWALIRKEFRDIRKNFADARRTQVGAEATEFAYDEEAYIVDEEAYVICTRLGWIKRQKSYSDISTIRVRDNDAIGWVLPGHTRETVLFFTNRGRVYTMRIDRVPATSGYGDPVQSHFDFGDGEQVVGVVTCDDRVLGPFDRDALPPECLTRVEADDEACPQFVAITAKGQGVRFSIDGFEDPSQAKGRLYVRLAEGDEVVNVELSRGDETVIIATYEGRALTFFAPEIAYYKGAAKGVRAIDLEGNDSVLDWTLTLDDYAGLEVETNRGARTDIRPSLSKFAQTSRGKKGRWVIKRGHLVRSHRGPLEIRLVDDDDAVSEEEE